MEIETDKVYRRQWGPDYVWYDKRTHTAHDTKKEAERHYDKRTFVNVALGEEVEE